MILRGSIVEVEARAGSIACTLIGRGKHVYGRCCANLAIHKFLLLGKIALYLQC